MEIKTPFIKDISFTNIDGFEHFEKEWNLLCKTLSTKVTSGVATGKIYVDLFPHGNFNYHFSNLLIAKYISIITGSKIVGLTCVNKLFVRFCYGNDDVVRLAESFGVDEIVDVGKFPTPHKFEYDSKQSLKDNARKVEEQSFGFSYKGFDNRLRRKLQLPHLDFVNVENDDICSEFELISSVNNWLDTLKMTSSDFFVCGHIEYDPYKRIGLELVKNRGTVIYNWVLQPFTLKPLRTEHDLLYNSSFTSELDFDYLYRSLVRKGVNFIEMKAKYLLALGKIRPTDVRDVTDTNTRAPLNRSGTNGILMLQSLSDAVHGYGPMLFDDFSSSVVETVDALIGSGARLTIRDHPMQHLYDQTGFYSHLKETYRNEDNIIFMDSSDELNLKNYDFCLTTQGTPGLEASLYGIEGIISGNSRYSSCGICTERTSKEDYFDSLLNYTKLPGYSLREREERASLYSFMELFLARDLSIFLPNGLGASPKDAIRYLGTFSRLDMVFTDPLFKRVESIVNNSSVTQNFDQMLSYQFFKG